MTEATSGGNGGGVQRRESTDLRYEPVVYLIASRRIKF